VLLSATAIILSEAEAPVKLIGFLLILLFLCPRLIDLKSACLLEHEINEDIWTYCSSKGKVTNGKLISAGYRSSSLLVIVIQSLDGVYHYYPVWADQLSPSDFSYLHLQLYLKPAVPAPRRIQALLKSWI